jgi:hypothetical protein
MFALSIHQYRLHQDMKKEFARLQLSKAEEKLLL